MAFGLKEQGGSHFESVENVRRLLCGKEGPDICAGTLGVDSAPPYITIHESSVNVKSLSTL